MRGIPDFPEIKALHIHAKDENPLPPSGIGCLTCRISGVVEPATLIYIINGTSYCPQHAIIVRNHEETDNPSS